MDRAKLEAAIKFYKFGHSLANGQNEHLAIMVDAAEHHLATLPKTKMVEVNRWVAFTVNDPRDVLITDLRAFEESREGRGQWVTFMVEVPA